MSTKFTPGKIAAATLLAFGMAAAQAGALLTFDPMATNGGPGNTLRVANSGGVFKADGINGGLLSTLTIDSYGGAFSTSTFTETGTITLDTFTKGGSALVSGITGLTTNYTLSATFTLIGVGTWVPTGLFVMDATNPTMTMSLVAKNLTTLNTITLGTGVLASAQAGSANTYKELFNDGTNNTSAANPVAGAGLLVGPSNATNNAIANNTTLARKALTNFTGILDFTPTGGTTGPFTGVGGFFRAPVPFEVSFDAGSVGGSTSNTSWTKGADGKVVFVTGGSGRTAGSANITFVNNNPVPEPASLALVGLALAAVGVVSRRRSTAKA